MIRVLRVIEYTYPDVETYWRDKSRWTIRGGPNNANIGFTSAVIAEHITDDEGNWAALNDGTKSTK